MGPRPRTHSRSHSLSNVDPEQASGVLGDILREENVYLGGSALGQGLKHAARYYLGNRANQQKPDYLALPGSAKLSPQVDTMPLEDSFYVVDLGVLVSQVYQWRRYFPRVEPFYAVKCNPDPIVVKTLATLGCNFDCASRGEIRLVQSVCETLPVKPEIIYANPCKGRGHLVEAVCRGVSMVTFDNFAEIEKCAAISPDIKLIMRIITDDRGSQCRLSSKFGAPRQKWRPLLQAAKQNGLPVVGVSFHVGSGCRDATRYEMALKDAKEIFEMAEKDFGMKMTILDIGGGFPGETHSLWNPAAELDEEEEDEKDVGKPLSDDGGDGAEAGEDSRFMFFTEIAEQVAPVLDEMFPESSGVRIIGEPGRYMVAASHTLCCSVIANRTNQVDNSFNPEPVNDREAAKTLDELTRDDQEEFLTRQSRKSLSLVESDNILSCIQEELADYSKLFASQQLAQQEVDIYTDKLDLYKEGFESATDMLGPPSEEQQSRAHHTVEGMTYPLVEWAGTEETQEDPATSLLTLAAAGEAAVNGVVLQAVADSAPLQDDYAYYINDGVYGAFNNIMFDHASVRPRVLGSSEKIVAKEEDGFMKLHPLENGNNHDDKHRPELFGSTVFGPTCDSIDVIARSVLLPKLKVGDWLYFNNMGAYTSAAASAFNGFIPSEKFYVCSVQPEYFEAMIEGPPVKEDEA